MRRHRTDEQARAFDRLETLVIDVFRQNPDQSLTSDFVYNCLSRQQRVNPIDVRGVIRRPLFELGDLGWRYCGQPNIWNHQ